MAAAGGQQMARQDRSRTLARNELQTCCINCGRRVCDAKPGGLRELHWHQNADEWQYYVQGRGRMTVFFNGGKAGTADFNAGDVCVVPRTFGHSIKNTGDTALMFLEVFKAPRVMDLSLLDWVANTPP